MRGVLVFLVVCGVSLGALAGIEGGVGLVPFHRGSSSFAVPFFTLGAHWELDGWGPAVHFGTDNPLIPNGWYLVGLEGRKQLTKAGYLAVGSDLYLALEDFVFTGKSSWTAYTKLGGLFLGHLDVWASLNFPLKADPDLPFFGAWLSLGVYYDFQEAARTGE